MKLLDPGLDSIALKIQEFRRIRLVAWIVTAAFLGLNLNIGVSFWLLAAVTCVESMMWLAAHPYRKGKGGTPRDRMAVLVAAIGLILACDAVAVLYWSVGTSGLRLMCAASIFAGLLHTQIFMSRSRTALIVGCTILTTTLFALMVFFGGYHGLERFTVAVFPWVTFAYVIAGGVASRHALEALETAKAQAVTASQVKSVFLATISHEIRTPLNGVLGMAQALAMDDLTPPQKERVDVVRRSGEALLHLLNDVLDISKIEAGKISLESIQFDLGELLRGTEEAFEELARTKGLVLTLEIADVEGIYYGDPTRIRQIVSNLVANALKFTLEGEVRVIGAADDRGVRLSVTDTGIGIPRASIGELFEKFTQVDATTNRRFGGTGLGLSICRELVGLMGGAVTVESELGRGSSFTVSLPLQRLEGRDERVVESPNTEVDGEARNLRILAAEDNLNNQIVLKTLLQCVDVDVTLVDNGLEAVEAWKTADWDLILMDVQMPVMDGPAATRIIRDHERALGRPRTRIVALTANGMAHQISDYLAAGMDEHLSKPIEINALFELLNSFSDAPAAEALAGAHVTGVARAS